MESDAFSADDKAALAVILDNKYMILDGLPIQHCMQKEVMTIFDTAADIHHSQSKNSTTLLQTEAVGKICYLASEYIQEGFVTVAIQIIDHTLVQGLVAGKNAFLNSVIYVQEETVEKLLNEIQVALLNPIEISQSGERVVFIGKTDMGIKIQMIFEKTGKLVTAYPILK